MARMFRDSRIGTIGGGTSEIMREIIAKVFIDDVTYKKAKSNVNSVSTNLSNKVNISSLEKIDNHQLKFAT